MYEEMTLLTVESRYSHLYCKVRASDSCLCRMTGDQAVLCFTGADET